jgi:hypothetical protein
LPFQEFQDFQARQDFGALQNPPVSFHQRHDPVAFLRRELPFRDGRQDGLGALGVAVG